LVCPNCESETNGLKLNNRLYCTECGFDLSKPKKDEAKPENTEPKPATERKGSSAPVREVKPDISFPEGLTPPAPTVIPPTEAKREAEQETEEAEKEILPETQTDEVASLEAEKEVLELVEEEAQKLEEEHRPDTTEKDQEAPRKVIEEAEEDADISVVVKKPVKLPRTTKTIKKHERPRTDLKREGDFVLIPGEPDPIAEPEITEATAASEPIEPEPNQKISEPDEQTVAEDSPEPQPEINENPSKDIDEVVEEVRQKAFKSDIEPKPLVNVDVKKEQDELKKKKEQEKEIATAEEEETIETADKPRTNDALLNFFKQATESKSDEPKKKRHHKTNKFNWKLFLSISIPFLIVLILVTLVLYVKFYAGKPEVFVKKAEEKTAFTHLTPGYIPVGYQAALDTKATANEIIYAYEYLPDRSKKLKVAAAQSDITPETIKDRIVVPTGKDYTAATEGDWELWHVGDNTIYFVSNGVLYTISSSDGLSKEELTKVATGLK